MFFKKKTTDQEDATMIAVRSATNRKDIVTGTNGKQKKQPYYFEHEGVQYEIKENRVIIALFVAPRRAGKTTLMTSMWHEARKNMGDGFAMEPYRMADYQRDELLKNLEDMISNTHLPRFESGVAPSNSLEVYNFIIYHKDHPRVCYMLRFIDVPGEWVSQHEDAMKLLISESDILYFPLSAPALLENQGDWNEEFNATQTIINLSNVFNADDIAKRSRLILFVPVKCEKYYWQMISGANDNSMMALNQLVSERYKPLIDAVQCNEDLKNDTVIAITPILTSGGQKFYQFVTLKDENGNEFHADTYVRDFTYVSPADPFRPTFCEQPLLYTLCFLKNGIENYIRKSGMKGFFNDAQQSGIGTAFHYAFTDPLCEEIIDRTRIADFAAFQSADDFRKTEAENGSVAERKYPIGLYTNVETLGYSVVYDPQSLYGQKQEERK